MRLQNVWLPFLLCTLALLTQSESRRVRVRPLPQEEEEESIQYYTAEPQDGEQVVYISSADQYNGLYGQQAASARSTQDNYIQQSRGQQSQKHVASKAKEAPKQPPVQTIRNYNKVNDDGSFTFGYEAADGSFKEETRGTDCVVRGKYGYVDPDGNKREFTYVSGNPCDPNAVKEEDLDERPSQEKDEPDDGPANYPTAPIRPLRPVRPVTVAPKPAVALFQNNYEQEEEEQPEPEQVLKQQPVQQNIRARPVYISRPQYEPEEERSQPQPPPPSPVYHRQRVLAVPSTTPASVIYKHSVSPINITPRPIKTSPARTEQPATTYRPQLLQVSVTPRPALLYTKQIASPARPTSYSASTASLLRDGGGSLDFDAEFQKFQQENNIVSPTPPTAIRKPAPAPKAPKPAAPTQTRGQVYSSELIYDPSSGQYNTQLYQTLPQTEGDFTLNHRIQPYVHQPRQQVLRVQEIQTQSPIYRSVRPNNNQAVYQQQQAELQFQNSAQLFAQQQKARSQQQQQTSPQQFYYVQPSLHQQQQGYQGGQIDAFLRGHNIQF